MSLAIALTGYFVLAIVGILDKFILTRTLPKPIVFAFYSSVFTLPALFLVPFGVVWPGEALAWLAALVSGVAFAAALWAMYQGFSEGEVSHMGPLVGATTPFFVALLGLTFLGEGFSAYQILAIALLFIGSFFISLQRKPASFKFFHGIAWAVAAGALFALSHVTAKYMYDSYGFYSGFVWTRGAIGLGGLAMIFSSSVRESLRGLGKKNNLEFLNPKSNSKLLVVGLDKILGVAGVVLVQYAIALGSVTIVNALAGVQYAALVVFVAIISKFAPRLFKEKYERGEMAQEMAAVAIIAVGLGILLVK